MQQWTSLEDLDSVLSQLLGCTRQTGTQTIAQNILERAAAARVYIRADEMPRMMKLVRAVRSICVYNVMTRLEMPVEIFQLTTTTFQTIEPAGASTASTASTTGATSTTGASSAATRFGRRVLVRRRSLGLGHGVLRRCRLRLPRNRPLLSPHFCQDATGAAGAPSALGSEARKKGSDITDRAKDQRGSCDSLESQGADVASPKISQEQASLPGDASLCTQASSGRPGDLWSRRPAPWRCRAPALAKAQIN